MMEMEVNAKQKKIPAPAQNRNKNQIRKSPTPSFAGAGADEPVMSLSTPPRIISNSITWQDGNQYHTMLTLPPPPQCQSQQEYQHIPKPRSVVTKVLLDARNPKASPSVSFRNPVQNVPSTMRLREINFNSNTEVQFNTYGVGKPGEGQRQRQLLYVSVMTNRIEGLHVTADTTYGVQAVRLKGSNGTAEGRLIPASKLPLNILPAIVVSEMQRYRQYEDNSRNRKTVLLTASTAVQ